MVFEVKFKILELKFYCKQIKRSRPFIIFILNAAYCRETTSAQTDIVAS